MNQYGSFAKFKILQGKRDEFVSILLQAAKSVATLKACHQYIVYKDAKDKNQVCVSEIWDSKEDHDNSLTNQSNKDLLMKGMSLLDGKPEVNELEVQGGISKHKT